MQVRSEIADVFLRTVKAEFAAVTPEVVAIVPLRRRPLKGGHRMNSNLVIVQHLGSYRYYESVRMLRQIFGDCH